MLHGPASDRDLLLRAQAGDERALDDLARAWRPFVAVICRQQCPSEEEAEDATQVALVKFLAHPERANPRRPLAPYVAAIARNTCRDFARRRSRRPQEAAPLNDGDPEAELLDSPGCAALDPERETIASEVGRHLGHCLAALDARARALLELHYLAGIPEERLPEYWPERFPLWRSRRTFYHQLRQAREAVRRCLEARGVDAAMASDFLHSPADSAYR